MDGKTKTESTCQGSLIKLSNQLQNFSKEDKFYYCFWTILCIAKWFLSKNLECGIFK